LVQRQRLEAAVTFCSYLRDLYDSLATRKIRDTSDFEWQKCFRVYTSNECGQASNPRFCVMDDAYSYGGEFYGFEQQAVLTPVTERCFLTLIQSGRLLKGSVICGRPNSGKTQTVKGFAQYLGKFIQVLSCTSQTHFSSIAATLQGLAQGGLWGLFDEVQNLSSLCLAWFTEYSSAIYQAVRRRVNQVHLADGKEVQINGNFSVTLAMNSLVGGGGGEVGLAEIPVCLKNNFRIVALMEPDFEMIMRIKCVQFGLKGANVLATKLKLLYDMSHWSLSSLQSRYQLTVSSFLNIIRLNCERDKKNDITRSNSFVSTLTPSASKLGAAKLESKQLFNRIQGCTFV